MRKKLVVLVAVVVVTLLIATQAAAIGGGELDGNEHPYVGLAVFSDADGGLLWRCSGTLLSPTVFLTAGHCVEQPATQAWIWFDADVESGIPDNGYPFIGEVHGTAYAHPNFYDSVWVLHDAGVVVLDTPMAMDEYGQLPPLGILDTLATRRGRQDTTITAVGYGLQRINPVFEEAERIRKKAVLNLVDVKGTAGIPAGTSVMLSGNHKTGGTCFGDSGGPQFLNDTNIVVAVTSFGLNGNCAGVGGGYRIDQPDDLNWLNAVLAAN